jgi:hypothetical protein
MKGLEIMNETPAGTALRMRKDNDYQGKPERYKHTYRVVPEGSEKPLFWCDVVGHAAHAEQSFLDSAGRQAFSMRPNRKILPTQWFVVESSGREIGRVDQKILGKGAWAAFDASDAEIFRIADAETRVDRVGKALLGGSTAKYCIMQGKRLSATMEMEPREKTTRKGLRGLLQAFLTPSDWVVRFSTDARELDIRLLVVAMVLLIDLTVSLDRTG